MNFIYFVIYIYIIKFFVKFLLTVWNCLTEYMIVYITKNINKLKFKKLIENMHDIFNININN